MKDSSQTYTVILYGQTQKINDSLRKKTSRSPDEKIFVSKIKKIQSKNSISNTDFYIHRIKVYLNYFLLTF